MTITQLAVLVAWIDRVISMDTACRTLGITRSQLTDLEHAAVAAELERLAACEPAHRARIMAVLGEQGAGS